MKVKASDTEQAMRYHVISDTYKEMRGSVVAIFRQVAIPMDDCEDMAQDVFLRLLTIDTLRPGTVKGMTAVVALRMRTDWLRHRAFVRRACKEMAATGERCSRTPDDLCRARELERMERMTVMRLAPKNRKVYEMSRYDGLGTGEIAAILGMTGRAAESRVYRARQEVRQRLERIYG